MHELGYVWSMHPGLQRARHALFPYCYAPSSHHLEIVVAACPVKAVKAWLAASGISEGPLFRPVAKGGRLMVQRLSAKAVCQIVKAYAGRLGLKAADFGAHSLRAGFLTSAARRGASVFKMRDVSRHKSMDVLQAYVRDADMFRDHAGAGLL
jgi:integrase